jgi:hypothetical protein
VNERKRNETVAPIDRPAVRLVMPDGRPSRGAPTLGISDAYTVPSRHISVTCAPSTPERIRFAMRFSAASIAARDSARGSTGRYVRSISTERRGMLRINRLMAVPPPLTHPLVSQGFGVWSTFSGTTWDNMKADRKV